MAGALGREIIADILAARGVVEDEQPVVAFVELSAKSVADVVEARAFGDFHPELRRELGIAQG